MVLPSVIINQLFPTAYMKVSLPQHVPSVLSVVDDYLIHSHEMHGIQNHNTTYDTSINEQILNDPRLNNFYEDVIKLANHFMNSRGYDLDRINFNPSFFVSEIKEGGFFHRHAHPNSILSGVFYADAEPDGASLILHDPRPTKHYVSLPVVHDTYWNEEERTIRSETGFLYIWDAWLEHEVTQHQSTKARKTLVFNL